MNTVIKNDRLTVTLKERGGELTSIKDADGTEYLWQGDAAYWSGQAPVLFPICGSLRGNTAKLQDGRVVSMPRHGIVRKRDFRLVQSSETTATYAIESTEQMWAQFPFSFKLENMYQVTSSSVTVTYAVTNTGNEEMPFTLGGHPGLRCPIYEGESFEDYAVVFDQTNALQVLENTLDGLGDRSDAHDLLVGIDTLPLCHGLFLDSEILISPNRSKSVQLIHQKTRKGVRMDFPDFENLILWCPQKGGNFVALEPWSGMTTYTDEDDRFEHKQYMKTLLAGQQQSFSYKITIL